MHPEVQPVGDNLGTAGPVKALDVRHQREGRRGSQRLRAEAPLQAVLRTARLTSLGPYEDRLGQTALSTFFKAACTRESAQAL
jgi:hypothetical protein